MSDSRFDSVEDGEIAESPEQQPPHSLPHSSTHSSSSSSSPRALDLGAKRSGSGSGSGKYDTHAHKSYSHSSSGDYAHSSTAHGSDGTRRSGSHTPRQSTHLMSGSGSSGSGSSGSRGGYGYSSSSVGSSGDSSRVQSQLRGVGVLPPPPLPPATSSRAGVSRFSSLGASGVQNVPPAPVELHPPPPPPLSVAVPLPPPPPPSLQKPKSLITVVSDPSLHTLPLNQSGTISSTAAEGLLTRPAPITITQSSSIVPPVSSSSSTPLSATSGLKPPSTHTIRTRPPSKSRSSSSSTVGLSNASGLLDAIADGKIIGGSADPGVSTLLRDVGSGDRSPRTVEIGSATLEDGHNSRNKIGENKILSTTTVSSSGTSRCDRSDESIVPSVSKIGIPPVNKSSLSIILPSREKEREPFLSGYKSSTVSVSSPKVDATLPEQVVSSSSSAKRPRLAWGQGLRPNMTPTAASATPTMSRAVSQGALVVPPSPMSPVPGMRRSQSELIGHQVLEAAQVQPLQTILSPRLTKGEISTDESKQLDSSAGKVEERKSKDRAKEDSAKEDSAKEVDCSSELIVSGCESRIDEICTGAGNNVQTSPEVIKPKLIESKTAQISTINLEAHPVSPKKVVKKAVEGSNVPQAKVKGKPGRPSLTDEEKAIKKAERKALKKKLLEEAAAAALSAENAVESTSGDTVEKSSEGSGVKSNLEGNTNISVSGSQQALLAESSQGPPKKKRGRPAGKNNTDQNRSPKVSIVGSTSGSRDDGEKKLPVSPRDSDKLIEKSKEKKDKKDKAKDVSSPRDQNAAVKTPKPVKGQPGDVEGEVDSNLTSSKSSKLRDGDKESKRPAKASRGSRKRSSGEITETSIGDSTPASNKRGKSKGHSVSKGDALYGGVPRIRRSRSELRQSASIGEIFTSLTDIRKSYFAVQNVLRLQVGISGLNQEGLDNLNKKISNPLSVVTLPIPPSSEIATCLDIIELHSNRLNDTLLELYEYQVEQQRRSLLDKKRAEKEMLNSKTSVAQEGPSCTTNPAIESGESSKSKSEPGATAGASRVPASSSKRSCPGLDMGLRINIPLTTNGNGAEVTHQLSTVHVSSPITILKKFRNNSTPRHAAPLVPTSTVVSNASSASTNNIYAKKTPIDVYKASLFLSPAEYTPFLQSNFTKARRANMVHVTAPVSAAVQDPRFTDHQLSFQRKDLERKRSTVTAEIRRRKISTLQAWESLGDRYLDVNHHWKHYTDHCGPKAVEERCTEQLGPRLRAVSAIASSSLNGNGSNGASDRDNSRSNPARFSSLRATSDIVRNDFDEEKRQQHQAMVELMKRRLEFGTADIPPMSTPWVQADSTVLPIQPVWPPTGMSIPDYATPNSDNSSVVGRVGDTTACKSASIDKGVAKSTSSDTLADHVTTGVISEKVTTDVSSLLLPSVPASSIVSDTESVKSSLIPSPSVDETTAVSEIKTEKTPSRPDVIAPETSCDKKEGDVKVGIMDTEGSLSEVAGEPTCLPKEQVPIQEPDFPKFVGNVPDIVDFNGCRLTLDGRRQQCSQVPIGMACPPNCNCAKQVDKLERMSRVWSDMEKCIFVDKFMQFPKNFHKISSFLVNRSTRDCIKFYYDSKAIIPFKALLREFDNRKRSLKNNWSHTCQAALSVGGVIYSPQQQLDDKEPHCELPAGEAVFTAHANHPPYMAIAKGLETPDEYGQYREVCEDALVRRPPRPLTDFLVARRHWKRIYDAQSTAEVEKLYKAKKNTLIVGDSLYQSKVPQKWVYLHDDEYSVYNDNNSSSNQKWSSSDEATQQLYHCRMGGNQTVVYQHPPYTVPNGSSDENSNYLSTVNSARRKKSKKEGSLDTVSVFGGYGLGSEYLAYAPLPTATTVHAAKQRNISVKSSSACVWDSIYPLEYMGAHTKIQKEHPCRSRVPIAQAITKRMATTARSSRVVDSSRSRSRGKPKGEDKHSLNEGDHKTSSESSGEASQCSTVPAVSEKEIECKHSESTGGIEIPEKEGHMIENSEASVSDVTRDEPVAARKTVAAVLERLAAAAAARNNCDADDDEDEESVEDALEESQLISKPKGHLCTPVISRSEESSVESYTGKKRPLPSDEENIEASSSTPVVVNAGDVILEGNVSTAVYSSESHHKTDPTGPVSPPAKSVSEKKGNVESEIFISSDLSNTTQTKSAESSECSDEPPHKRPALSNEDGSP